MNDGNAPLDGTWGATIKLSGTMLSITPWVSTLGAGGFTPLRYYDWAYAYVK